MTASPAAAGAVPGLAPAPGLGPVVAAMAVGDALTQPATWDQERWVGILDRIEYRNAGIGLRFWGPPLSLEVTMSGPDSADWSIAAAGPLSERSWNWHSGFSCPQVADLADAGADDDALLAVVARYTLENLVLNSLHEIGEWLRFDACRLFPTHGEWDARTEVPDPTQGNGVVNLLLDFNEGPWARMPPGPGAEVGQRAELQARVGAVVPPWRFTYLPATTISYGGSGPTITDAGPGRATPVVWESAWSESTLGLADPPVAGLTGAVQRDVHRMLAAYETDRICRSLFVDGRQRWFLATGGPGGPGTVGVIGGDASPVRLALSHRGNDDSVSAT